MTMTDRRADPLDEEMLARFDQRAPQYDRENRFFTEDFEELRERGFFTASLPVDYGGAAMSLGEVNRLIRRIAYVAPATAVAVNMHHYFVGLCADLHRAGDPSGDWVLQRAAEGEIFAAGHAEAGNDVPVMLSTSNAERVDGGWEISGHKIFGSLSPVWTYLPGSPCHGHERRRQPEGRARLHPPRHPWVPDRGDLGHDGHAGDDITRHDPGSRVRA